jgi:hypothetical protein
MILDTFRQDVRVGCRVLLKEKTFCILAAIVLALGIGGVTTQFTVVNAFVLRGFSFPQPEQLMSVGLIDPQGTDQQNNFGNGNIPTAQDYEDLKAGQQSFALMAGYLNGSTINVTYKENPQRYTGGYVTEDFFRIVGVSPIIGRDFTADDNKPGAEKTTILGHEIWQRDFGGDPNIVGQSVRINGKAATIIGVMPQGFKFPQAEQLWVPLYNKFPIKPSDDSRARRGPRHSCRAMGSKPAGSRHKRAAVPAALLGEIRDRREGAPLHRRHHFVRDAGLGIYPGVSECSRESR